jgi:hypothetical protein
MLMGTENFCFLSDGAQVPHRRAVAMCAVVPAFSSNITRRLKSDNENPLTKCQVQKKGSR